MWVLGIRWCWLVWSRFWFVLPQREEVCRCGQSMRRERLRSGYQSRGRRGENFRKRSRRAGNGISASASEAIGIGIPRHYMVFEVWSLVSDVPWCAWERQGGCSLQLGGAEAVVMTSALLVVRRPETSTTASDATGDKPQATGHPHHGSFQVHGNPSSGQSVILFSAGTLPWLPHLSPRHGCTETWTA